MRTLALGLGNSSLIGGVFDSAQLIRSFRRAPHQRPLVRGRFDAVALCSVVPALTTDLVAWCETQLGLTPRVLNARAAHGLTLGYREPHRLGTDRLAAAVGARALHPGKNVIVVDRGTATTVTALRRDGHLVGGAILPGLSLWGDAWPRAPRSSPASPRPGRAARSAAPRAEGVARAGPISADLGAVREVVARVAAEAFGRQRFIVMGTGGHAPALHGEGLFTEHEPVLVLRGLQAFAAEIFPDSHAPHVPPRQAAPRYPSPPPTATTRARSPSTAPCVARRACSSWSRWTSTTSPTVRVSRPT